MTKEEYRAEIHKQLDAVDALPDGCDILNGYVGGSSGSSILLFDRYNVPTPIDSRVVHGDRGDYTVFSTPVCGVRVAWNTAGIDQ